MEMIPRHYQVDCHAAIVRELETVNATLAVLATGVGKTFIASMVTASRMHMGSTLFLCHRQELVWQAVKAFKDAIGISAEVEMGKIPAVLNGYDGKFPPVVISTVQTQYSGAGGEGRMTRFDPKRFATIVIDEAHHYLAPSFLRVLDYYRRGNPAIKLVGFTATPDRRDKRAMGKLFETVAYEYGIKPGIKDGWLVPIDQYTGFLSGMDLSNVASVAGDLNPEQLARVMEEKKNLFGIAEEVLARVGERKTLLFASSVNHAELLAAIFNNRARDRVAEHVSAKTPDRERADILRRFYSRQFQYLCNVGIATEGFNDEGIEVVVCARPTTSRALYTQMAGRGTRTLPGVVDGYEHADDRRVAIAESSKPALELIDFAGNAGKHKLITGVDILGGDYEDEVVQRVKKNSEGKRVDITAALEAEWVALKAEREAAKQIEASKLAQLQISHQCEFWEVDPFSHAGNDNSGTRKPAKVNRSSPATDAQKRLLANVGPKGIDLDKLTLGQAGRIVAEIKRRSSAGLCSMNQAKVLTENGLPCDVPRDTAKIWLDRIARNNWQVPQVVRAEAELYREPVQQVMQ